MVNINDPGMEMIYKEFSELGKQLYNRDVQEDDDKKFQTVVNGMILILSGCPVSSSIIKSAVDAKTPEQEQTFDYSVNALLDGVRSAAVKVGHVKNADYVSRLIEKRLGK